MSKFIGRRVSMGMAKETSRGTFVTPAYWIPQTAVDLDEVVEQIRHEGAIGRIEDISGIDVVEKKAQGTIEGRIHDTMFGLMLLGIADSETSAQLETTAYSHTFAVNNVNQPKTFSFAMSEPNASGASSRGFTLAVIQQLEMMFEMRKYAMFKANILANTSATQNVTPSFTAENYFTPVHCGFKFASAQSGLAGASVVPVRRMNIVINRNIEEDYNLGSLAATDRLNKQLSIEATVELVYDDRSYIDTYLVADLARAFRLQAINTGVTIGASNNPTLIIDIYAGKLTEVARKMDNDGIVTQTVKIKGYYSLTDSAMFKAILYNTKNAAY